MRQRAAIALGRLPVGDFNFTHTDTVMKALLATADEVCLKTDFTEWCYYGQYIMFFISFNLSLNKSVVWYSIDECDISCKMKVFYDCIAGRTLVKIYTKL